MAADYIPVTHGGLCPRQLIQLRLSDRYSATRCAAPPSSLSASAGGSCLRLEAFYDEAGDGLEMLAIAGEEGEPVFQGGERVVRISGLSESRE